MDWMLFFMETGLYVHKENISVIKWAEFTSNRMSYITLRGPWYDTIVLNLHVQTEVKSDDMKYDFHWELEHIFHQFPKYHIKTS